MRAVRTFVVVGLAAVVLGACEDGKPTSPDDAGANGEAPTQSDAGVLLPGDASGADAGAVDANAQDQLAGGGLPCDVAAIVGEHCTLCHAAQPRFGAPMSLLRQSDFVAPALSEPGKQVRELAMLLLHDPRSPMPPTTQTPLSAAELATLDAWLAAGAPPSDEVCTVSTHDAGTEPPFDWSQCTHDVELLAHGQNTLPDSTGYAVPAEDDHYECFNFEVPWSGEVHGINFEPIIDQERVVHHWNLYELSGFAAPAYGSHGNCGHARTFLATWAPGAKAGRPPDDVGMQLPTHDSLLQLEVHYNNVRRYSDVQDRSGVRVCATDKLREHTAFVHKLGATDIELKPGEKKDVVNTCTVLSTNGDAHVLSSFPHMHKLGLHLKTTIKRANGQIETLIDTPFDFENQGFRQTPAIIHEGDVLTTTCSFDNTSDQVVKWGEGTGDEMCYNHVVAWPPHSVTSTPHGKDCIGLLPSSVH